MQFRLYCNLEPIWAEEQLRQHVMGHEATYELTLLATGSKMMAARAAQKAAQAERERQRGG